MSNTTPRILFGAGIVAKRRSMDSTYAMLLCGGTLVGFGQSPWRDTAVRLFIASVCSLLGTSAFFLPQSGEEVYAFVRHWVFI